MQNFHSCILIINKNKLPYDVLREVSGVVWTSYPLLLSFPLTLRFPFSSQQLPSSSSFFPLLPPKDFARILYKSVRERREDISPVAMLLKMSPSLAIHSQRKVGPSGSLWLSIDRPILCRSGLSLWVQGHSQAVAGRKWSTALCPTPDFTFYPPSLLCHSLSFGEGNWDA